MEFVEPLYNEILNYTYIDLHLIFGTNRKDHKLLMGKGKGKRLNAKESRLEFERFT